MLRHVTVSAFKAIQEAKIDFVRLTVFVGENAARVIALVPREVVKEMQVNLVKWKLNDIVEVAEWGY